MSDDNEIKDPSSSKIQIPEKQFFMVFQESNISMVIISPDGDFISVNPAFCKMMGYSSEELLKLKILDITHPKDLKLTTDSFLDIKEKKANVFHLEKRYVHKDGTAVWGNVTSVLFIDSDEKPLYLIAMIEDISERKRIEEERNMRLERVKRQQDTILKISKNSDVIKGVFLSATQMITQEAAQALEVERASIWLLSQDRQKLRCIDLYENTQRRHSDGVVLHSTDYPKYFESLESGRAVDANDARTDPRTNEFAEKYLTPLGITSMLDAAIRVAGQVIGVICQEHVGEKRIWTADEIAFACEIADQMAQVLVNSERNQAIEDLHKAHDDLEKRVGERTANLLEENLQRKKAEDALKSSQEDLLKKTVALEQKNLALKEILEQIEIEKKQIKDDVVANVENLLMPILKKLKRKGTSLDRKNIDVLEENLKHITSSFGGKVSDVALKLTPREVEICTMIKNGLSSKEISEVLKISFRTIEIHRTNIRKKLGINRQGVNLTTYLQSI